MRSPDNASAVHEHTIRSPVSVRGVGLHSGAPVNLRLLPSPSGKGVIFARTDLAGFEIPASWRHVARVSYATSLMRQGVLLSTTEHLLSVLRALGIDNVRVEIDNLEVPILDGSARPFAELIHQAGIRRQRRRRRYMRIRKKVEIAENGKRISVEPSEAFDVDCRTDYNKPGVAEQQVQIQITPESYIREIGPARTFGFENELPAMQDMGLIRGASLDNAVCFREDGTVRNEEGLRYENEPCRHKVLDLIGDLALLGHSVLGKVVASRTGHAMHVALVDRIMKNPESYEIAPLP